MKKLEEGIDIVIWLITIISLVIFSIHRWTTGNESVSVSTRISDAVGISFLQALGVCLVLMAIKFVIMDVLIMKKEMKDDEQKKQKGA